MKFNRKIKELYSYKFKTEYENASINICIRKIDIWCKNKQYLLHNYNIERKNVNEFQHIFRNSMWRKASPTFNEKRKPKDEQSLYK